MTGYKLILPPSSRGGVSADAAIQIIKSAALCGFETKCFTMVLRKNNDLVYNHFYVIASNEKIIHC